MKRAKTLKGKEKQNEDLYKDHKTGKYSMYELALKYGITQPRVHQIVRRMEAEEPF